MCFSSRKAGVHNPEGEWFQCGVEQVKAAIVSVSERQNIEITRSAHFRLRPEQEEAVNKTRAYFESFRREKENTGKTPRFLWNAKMRFGKTFTTYHLGSRRAKRQQRQCNRLLRGTPSRSDMRA